MQFLVAASVLLLVGFAGADLKLSYPGFMREKTHVYDIWINTTSGIPGMTSQVAKSAMNMECKIYAVTEHVVYMSISKVLVSNSVASVGSRTDPMEMKANKDLEEHLKIPIKVSFQNGRVKSYTLDSDETLMSKKIKKTVMRHFQTYFDKDALKSIGSSIHWPITFDRTRTSPGGNYSSHYVITNSPYTDFPKERNVINITRTDNYEVIPYPAYHTHHNFEQQGCPGVCKSDHVENRFHAGCPAEWEPYQTPMKKSFVQHHNLRKAQIGKTIFTDIIKTKETHVADIYDQNMEVIIETFIRYQHASGTRIPEPTGQTSYTDLDDWNLEANVEEINRYCKHTTAEQAIPTVKEILNRITKIVHEGSIEGEGKDIGEKLVLLQKALTLLRRKDLEKLQEDITTYEEISKASAEEKIKRQIWLENLPLIGTSDSVSFIVDLIKKSINEKHNGIISLWESKNILEALPMNILEPTGKTIQEMSELLEALRDRTVPGYGMYYSAVHIAVARVIRNMCSVSNGIPEVEETRSNYLHQLLRETDDDYKNSKCPRTEAKKFVMDIFEKIKGNEDRLKRIIYNQALSQTGLKSVLPILKSCAEGHISVETPSYRNYVRSCCINALYNLVTKHPQLVKSIVFPIYSNKTEPPKLRTAAFGVFVKSYPTLGDWQNVAEQSGHEPSQEVCSYVTSAMETVGNSTIPCDQLTARRIKKVMSQVKRCAIGKHHAQSIHSTSFDAVRGFGIDHHFEFTPSNESFVPSSIFARLGYNADSLGDTFFKYAFNSQGFNSVNFWDHILRALNLKVAEDIPKSKESEIFPEIVMADRANEFWRFVIYEKLFYSLSYYYMDDAEYQKGDILSLVKRHLKNYFTFESNGKIHGHLVKLWLPSSYQSKAIAQTLPFPVQFEMRNPMLLSLKLDVDMNDRGVSVNAHPTYYRSMLHSNEILNLGDCKHVGVYHEQKLAVTYPFKTSFSVEQGQTLFSYSFPEFERQNKKKILTYHSEAGTYAKKHNLAVLPSSTERRTIMTIPSLYVRNNTGGFVGLPLFEINTLTEDISLGYEEIPLRSMEAVNLFVRDYLNAGWRRKTIEVYRKADSQMWGPKTQVKMIVRHRHSFVKSKQQVKPDNSWLNAINFDKNDEKEYLSEERDVSDKVSEMSHLHDRLSISVEQKVNETVTNKARLEVDHNRTLESYLHSWRVSANATASGRTFGVLIKGAAVYTNRPNEFNYGDDGYGKQRGAIIASIWFPHHDKPYMAGKIVLSYKSLEQHLNKDLQTPLSAKYFYPETHEKCLQDKASGNSQSVNCIKAIRSYAEFNRMGLKLVWNQDLPPIVKEISRKIELAVIHTYFNHLSIETKKSVRKSLQIDVTNINKMTDKRVVDIAITNPTEVVRLLKVDPGVILPVSSIFSVPETYIQYYTNNSYPATCSLSEKYVTTYDLKTIRLPRDGSCSYVLTTHCVRHKKFAVIVKIDPEHQERRDIHLYIGKHSLVLTPARKSKYEIKYDNRSYTVRYLLPIMLHETERIYAVVNRVTRDVSYIEIHAEKAGIKVTYDGKHVKTQVHPRYKGELCGLCSEFNGETVRQLRGCNGCLFSHVDDFTASSGLGSCYRRKPVHRAICNNNDYENSDISDQDEIHEDNREKEYEPTIKRNKVLLRDDKVCISTRPLHVCTSQDAPKKTETKEIEFHCLPKSDSNAKKLVIESKRRILGELEPKEVDIKEHIEYPTICVKQ